MICDRDLNRIRELQEDNPELDYLFEELKNDYATTISCISHELRNSLTLIIGALQLIEDFHPETKGFKHWAEVMEDLDEMKSFLLNVSDYNNSEKLSLSRVNLSALLRDVQNACLTLIGNTNKTLEYQDGTEPIFVWGDAKKLRRAFVNLIKNAIEAVREDGHIIVSLKAEEELVTVDICDNGIGITATQLPEIFKPFMTFKQHGTGLGLPISKKIIEAHHGTIQLTSVPKGGSMFTIALHRTESHS